eukprot:TRINITY_DN5654_c0_g1_i1.p1 TRINITY_DN5654_c0_g1~~TRINITY_DN5654_c0_g1_i1.p1  ORF type:complete len:545 (+),score=125.93 TRINITY_DN5654_c0_g1_i1:133-1635(+)
MAFPAESLLERTWRNSIKHVCEFLELNHSHHWMVWNLSERSYRTGKLKERIIANPFVDHHPPELSLLATIMSLMHSWITASEDNICVVHCIGGKGRTGTIISSYLLYSGYYDDASECMDHFGEMRSTEGKGVTQPSQRRYIEYFEHIIKGNPVFIRPIVLCEIKLGPMPMNHEYGLKVFTSPNHGDEIYSSFPVYKKSKCRKHILTFRVNQVVHRDLYVKIVKKKPVTGKIIDKFHIVLHTYFIDRERMIFPKSVIDMCDGKKIPETMTLEIQFSKINKDLDTNEYQLEPELENVRRDYASRNNIQDIEFIEPSMSEYVHRSKRRPLGALEIARYQRESRANSGSSPDSDTETETELMDSPRNVTFQSSDNVRDIEGDRLREENISSGAVRKRSLAFCVPDEFPVKERFVKKDESVFYLPDSLVDSLLSTNDSDDFSSFSEILPPAEGEEYSSESEEEEEVANSFKQHDFLKQRKGKIQDIQVGSRKISLLSGHRKLSPK